MANSEDRNRGLINYSSRDYNSLMEEFWDIVPKLTSLWKPEAESDPGVVLGKYLASVADMLGVNLDWLANEMFAPSVTQRKNAERIFGLVGYDLGWYTAARTEVTFKNKLTSGNNIELDFSFTGNSFSTLNAYSDITSESRVITYNILPFTNKYGVTETRSTRKTITDRVDIFGEGDKVVLKPGESVTRVAIEGELRNYSISVEQIKANNYIIKLPSQHVDTTAIWIKAKSSSTSDDFLSTRWVQCTNPAEFNLPEPRFAVTYDSYSNAQIQISNYLNELDNYNGNYLVIYWIDCSGVIGCVKDGAFTSYSQAATNTNTSFTDPANAFDSGALDISNLSNTLELPHTHVVTGKSPETAKEAYRNSRNYINTFDSLVTLPDFGRFLNREPGIDTGVVIDCQKALDINMSIYNDENLTDIQKSKMYITYLDFPEGSSDIDWASISDKFDPSNKSKYLFNHNFKTNTLMCFAVHNEFENSVWGDGKDGKAVYKDGVCFKRYCPPPALVEGVKKDFAPLQCMVKNLEFGYLRIFEFYVVGQIYPKRPVTKDVGNNIIEKVKEALSLHFSPSNKDIGEKPTVMEVVNVIRNADDMIDYFDAGSISNPVINWYNCDIDYFNQISFAKLMKQEDIPSTSPNIRIAPEYIVDNN